jgi:ABC-2 type transport system permease protein
MNAAIEVEWLKLRRSRTAAITGVVLVLGIPALVAGFMRAAVNSPRSQLSVKVRAMVSGTGWAAYLGLAEQIVAVAVLLGVGVVVAWCFGREFSDRTLVSLSTPCRSRAGPSPRRRPSSSPPGRAWSASW